MVTNRIGTVSDVPGQGWRSADEYQASHAARVAERRRLRGLSGLQVYRNDAVVEAYIAGGIWRIRCDCGDAPSTHPEWKIACCAGCGAVHTNVVFPAGEEWEAIEAVLLKRRQRDRNWLPAWDLAHVTAENIAHGDPT